MQDVLENPILGKPFFILESNFELLLFEIGGRNLEEND